MEQYSVLNKTGITLYLNSLDIELKPNEKKWIYFNIFDIRYVLSEIGVVVITHEYDDIVIKSIGQLSYLLDMDNVINIYRKEK